MNPHYVHPSRCFMCMDFKKRKIMAKVENVKKNHLKCTQEKSNRNNTRRMLHNLKQLKASIVACLARIYIQVASLPGLRYFLSTL